MKEVKERIAEIIDNCVLAYAQDTTGAAIGGVDRAAGEILELVRATPASDSAWCDCGAPAAADCEGCIVAGYQAQHPECAYCCPVPASDGGEVREIEREKKLIDALVPFSAAARLAVVEGAADGDVVSVDLHAGCFRRAESALSALLSSTPKLPTVADGRVRELIGRLLDAADTVRRCHEQQKYEYVRREAEAKYWHLWDEAAPGLRALLSGTPQVEGEATADTEELIRGRIRHALVLCRRIGGSAERVAEQLEAITDTCIRQIDRILSAPSVAPTPHPGIRDACTRCASPDACADEEQCQMYVLPAALRSAPTGEGEAPVVPLLWREELPVCAESGDPGCMDCVEGLHEFNRDGSMIITRCACGGEDVYGAIHHADGCEVEAMFAAPVPAREGEELAAGEDEAIRAGITALEENRKFAAVMRQEPRISTAQLKWTIDTINELAARLRGEGGGE